MFSLHPGLLPPSSLRTPRSPRGPRTGRLSSGPSARGSGSLGPSRALVPSDTHTSEVGEQTIKMTRRRRKRSSLFRSLWRWSLFYLAFEEETQRRWVLGDLGFPRRTSVSLDRVVSSLRRCPAGVPTVLCYLGFPRRTSVSLGPDHVLTPTVPCRGTNGTV